MDALKSYFEISPFFFVITASSSLLYMTMNFFMLFGNFEGDFGDQVSTDFAFKFFSTQTVLAFFMGFGWAGVTSTVKWHFPMWQALLIAFGFGLVLMMFSAFLLFQVRKLNHHSKFSLISTIGERAKVYSRIPVLGNGQGSVEVQVNGALKVVPAVSTKEALESFLEVEVVGVKDKVILVVQPINKKTDFNGDST